MAVLQVKLRQTKGSSRARKLRAAGKVPGVVYGHGEKAVSVEVSAEEVLAVVRHGTRVVDMEGDISEKALIKGLQWDTFGTELLHLDLNRVSADERVTVEVAIELRGDAPGIKQGGVVEHLVHSVEVECPVISVPDKLVLNINHLELLQELTAEKLDLAPGVKLLIPMDTVIAQCVEPAKEEDAPAAEGAAEPELIGKKKEEEGEEDKKDKK
jgi:large subunit ribosomal protein L25